MALCGAISRAAHRCTLSGVSGPQFQRGYATTTPRTRMASRDDRIADKAHVPIRSAAGESQGQAADLPEPSDIVPTPDCFLLRRNGVTCVLDRNIELGIRHSGRHSDCWFVSCINAADSRSNTQEEIWLRTRLLWRRVSGRRPLDTTDDHRRIPSRCLNDLPKM